MASVVTAPTTWRRVNPSDLYTASSRRWRRTQTRRAWVSVTAASAAVAPADGDGQSGDALHVLQARRDGHAHELVRVRLLHPRQGGLAAGSIRDPHA